MNIRQFNHSPHPYWLPNFMDVFTWSLPFVAEKVAEMLLVVLNLCDDEKEENQEKQEAIREGEKEKQRERMRAKVKSVSKMMRMYSILRKERETLMQIKAFTPENKIPPGLLSGGVEAIRDALGNFEKAKNADKINEKRPPGVQRQTSNARLHSMRLSQEFSLRNSQESLTSSGHQSSSSPSSTTPSPSSSSTSPAPGDLQKPKT